MRRIGAVLESIAAGLLIAAVLLNFANVLARYVFSRPIVTAEEILQYSNVWVVMLAMPAVTMLNLHLRMDFLLYAISRRVMKVLETLITMLGAALTAYVVVQSVKIVGLTFDMGQRSIASGLPLYLVHCAVPIGFGCSSVFLLERLWKLWLRPDEAEAR